MQRSELEAAPAPALYKRAAVLGVVAALLALAHFSGALELLSKRGEAEALLENLGIWSYVLYVVAFSLLEPFFVPGILFVAPASVIWPFWVAFPLSWAGAVGAGIVGFGFARYLARGWVEDHLPEDVRRFDDRLAERGLLTVVIVRLTLFLMPPAHWALGLSRVRFGSFVLGSMLGFLPGMALLAWFGDEMIIWFSGLSWQWQLLVVGGSVAFWVAIARWRRARTRAQAVGS